jgi:hypothetical protein
MDMKRTPSEGRHLDLGSMGMPAGAYQIFEKLGSVPWSGIF